MKKLLLITAIFAAVGSGSVLAKDPSHYCVCNDKMKEGKAVQNWEEADCVKACGSKNKWTGKATFQNPSDPKKFKGIVCKCENFNTAPIKCTSACWRKGWKQKVYFTKAGGSTIEVQESRSEV